MDKKVLLFGLFLLQSSVCFCQGNSLLNKKMFALDSISSFPLLVPGGTAAHLPVSKKDVLVIAFLSPECPLCKNYSSKLVELSKKYNSAANFVGIIPGSFEAEDVVDFQKSYMPSWQLLRDTSLHLTHYLQGEVTPEVLVIDSKTGVLIYKGAIDNWLVSLGKTRNKVTQFYLDVAIENFINDKPSIPFTKPTGCLINDF